MADPSNPGDGPGFSVATLQFTDAEGVTPEYDPGRDGLLDPSSNPNEQFLAAYYPLDSNGAQADVDHNLAPHPSLGDTYTAYFSLVDHSGTGYFGDVTLDFQQFDLSDNPNGVGDFIYAARIDSDLNVTPETFFFGQVSKTNSTEGAELGTWLQLVLPGFDYEVGNFVFGEITFTAIAGSNSGETLEADFNGDHFVDDADLFIWVNQFGSTGAVSADANSDGAVSGTDFLVWQGQHGSNAGSAVSAAPEPATNVIVGFVAVLAGGGYRIRRRAA